MVNTIIDAMVFCGAALMVFNVYGFIRYSRFVRKQEFWNRSAAILHIPVFLLIFFLLGYLVVGIFGKPDLMVAGILFGGSIFVFIIYKLITGITKQIIGGEKIVAQHMAEEEANRAKTSFLASVSHEMRTPMNVILGLNGMVLKNPALPAEARAQSEKIGLSARYLLGLINNLLDLSEQKNGAELSEVSFSLSELVQQTGAILNAVCDEKGLSYHEEVGLDTEARFRGDEARIKQVLLALLDNAVKYTDAPGSVSFTAQRVSEDAGVRTLRFTVSDTGVGIEPDFLPHIFEAFTQEDSSFTNRFGGGGLSLSVAKRNVELMGGTIGVESRKGVGTTVTVTLPLSLVPAEEKREEAPEAPETLAGKRVLVVEDIPDNAEIVMDLLELEDVETEHAENGQIAVDMFEKAPEGYYDAILMDLRMPVMDGLEATRRIRALDRPDAKSAPIIALSANAFESDLKATKAAGMNAHLAKPADSNELYSALRQWIFLKEEKKGDGEI